MNQLTTTSMSRLRVLLLLLVGAALLAGCKRDLDKVGTDTENPIVVLVSPAHAASPAQLQALSGYLERETKLRVQVGVAKSHQNAIVQFQNQRADVGLLPLFPYLFCHQEFGVKAVLRVVRKGGATSYRGEVLVKKDSPIKSTQDLAGKTVAFTNHYSVTGFLLPLELLVQNKLNVTPRFTGGHEAALAALRAGKVDAAATYSGIKADDLRVVAQTQSVPNEPVFFRPSLSMDLQWTLYNALVKLGGSPEGRAILRPFADIEGFTKTADADYANTFATIRKAGKRVPDLVADGWQIYANERLSAEDFAP